MARVLIIDDRPMTVRGIWRYLRNHGYDVEVATSGGGGLQMARRKIPDVILLNVTLPGLSGLDVLQELLRDRDPAFKRIPVIMLSAANTEAEAVQALDLGAQDYILKPVKLTVFAARLRMALRVKFNQEALERANEYLLTLSSIDPLTQTFNRRRFYELATRELAKAQRFQRELSAIMIDADHFKALNDRFGHALGDKALCMLADVLRKSCRDIDIIARMGGEEFAVCCPETNLGGAMQLAERIRRGIEVASFNLGPGTVRVTVSVGVATLCDIDRSVDSLLERADRMMYRAKQGGRNRVVGA
ncbi:diguanylate cyclase [Exilibacterium tricleocarpae]|uniref:diguanylate cyclase n=1 Tax=Exilibacterium tricleocarpae TaxID=2591008 RepID=A0A545U5Q1_9GAMM|nr:diguanylate cyclase [Exilibacterium tricleocarpae]TQV84805.1 diguanylate cyclase [Exilibacterium tricleocarpae]